jgi:hypothetical protein
VLGEIPNTSGRLIAMGTMPMFSKRTRMHSRTMHDGDAGR